MPDFTFPTVGPLGFGSPPFRPEITPDHRYYVQLRLPKAHLRSVRCSLSAPDTWHPHLLLCSFSGSHEGHGVLTSYARDFGHGIPHRYLCKETIGSPEFPNYPHEYMPWSKTPVVTCILAISHSGLLPSGFQKPSALLLMKQKLS